MTRVRLTAEEKGTKLFDYLWTTTRPTIHAIMAGTGLKRTQVNHAIRWNRDTLGHEALICNVDGTYELATSSASVADYRKRRQAKIANEMERLYRVLKAGTTKFGPESDEVLAGELLKTAVSLLRRSTTDQGKLFERVH